MEGLEPYDLWIKVDPKDVTTIPAAFLRQEFYNRPDLGIGVAETITKLNLTSYIRLMVAETLIKYRSVKP